VPALIMGCVFIAAFGFVQPYALSRGAREVRGFFLGFTCSAVLCRVFLGGLGDRLDGASCRSGCSSATGWPCS